LPELAASSSDINTIHVLHDNNTLGTYHKWSYAGFSGNHTDGKGDLAMFMPAMFGLYFALMGMIAWDDYQASR
jgi:hypothetical protein